MVKVNPILIIEAKKAIETAFYYSAKHLHIKDELDKINCVKALELRLVEFVNEFKEKIYDVTVAVRKPNVFKRLPFHYKAVGVTAKKNYIEMMIELEKYFETRHKELTGTAIKCKINADIEKENIGLSFHPISMFE
ncbi:MAG: hypothetical protein I8H98_11280 [Moraxellaceae bacterium]|nr:hypothetical protein [Moraxellaceae bacterium]